MARQNHKQNYKPCAWLLSGALEVWSSRLRLRF